MAKKISWRPVSMSGLYDDAADAAMISEHYDIPFPNVVDGVARSANFAPPEYCAEVFVANRARRQRERRK